MAVTMGRPRPPLRRRRSGLVARLLRGLLVLILLAVLLLGGVLWWTLPASSTNLVLPGLGAPVAITLDAQGVPRIQAETEHDAAMALGWLHARDRLFQMELMRRGAQGRLAELAGPAVLRSDRFVRLLGLARHAREDLATLPAETREMLEAYAAGVNAWIGAHGRFAAPEFLLLGSPEPWMPEHCLLWAKVMGVWLSGDWRVELDRAALTGRLPPERIEELWPTDPSAGRPDLVTAATIDPGHAARLAAAIPRFPEPGSLPASASNAWTVGAARSASGAPLLANDPHLGFGAPILWYLARIDLPGGRMLAGATSPGVPFIIIGRNDRLAWGFTTTHADTQDIFLERLVGEDQYQTPDGPRPFTIREETIAIRGAPPEVLRVRETRHGPVLSDLDRNAPAGMALAVAMANLARADTAAAGLQLLNRARGMTEARTAAALVSSPSQNLLVADAAGPIGLFVTGRLPVRAGGDGSRPAIGWDGSQDWTGWLAFDALPHVENPDSGAIANANNRVVPADHPAFLGRDWFGDWRFRRIGELLAARPKQSADNFAAMQNDTVSLLARDLLARNPSGPDGLLRRLPRPQPGAAGAALELLLTWNGEMDAPLPQPLILNAWVRRFFALAMTAGGVPESGWAASQPELVRWLASEPPEAAAHWCGGDCTALAVRALRESVATLAETEGPDPTAWRWGRVHVARFEHPLLRVVPGIQALVRLHAVTAGDGETLSRGGFTGRGATPWAHVHGAGLRLVADLADPERTLAIIATGQSGHPMSAHWGDLLGVWRDGGTLTLTREPASVAGRIALRP